MIPTILTYDATSANEPVLPNNAMVAGYDTQAGGGTGVIAWTSAQFAAHTKPFPALHIDQDQNASDTTADFLDVEAGAAQDNEIVNWLGRARAAYTQGKRLGQRWPGIYSSQSNVTSLVALLQQANVSNVPFWVANYSMSEQGAQAAVANALGPFPAVGFQYTDQGFGGKADVSYFSVPYIQSTNDPNQPVEDFPMFAQFNNFAFVPFPAGTYKQLMLYRDFTSPSQSPEIRVAVRSVSKGYTITEQTLSESVPVTIDFADTDVDAVSLSLISGGTGPIGYWLS